MRRILVVLTALCLLLAGLPSAASAAGAQLKLLEGNYKFYPLQDVVFVEFYNPNGSAVNNITVNMVIREGTGRNRVLAIGQTKLPSNLMLKTGESTSARIPIRARVVRDIPALAQFEFRISGTQVADNAVQPDILVQDSVNGTTLEFNRDSNGTPMVIGFIGLDPAVTQATTVQVHSAILTFYDSDRRIVWSEVMPIGGTLSNNGFLMIWGKYEQINNMLVPDLTSVSAKFVLGSSTGQNGQ